MTQFANLMAATVTAHTKWTKEPLRMSSSSLSIDDLTPIGGVGQSTGSSLCDFLIRKTCDAVGDAARRASSLSSMSETWWSTSWMDSTISWCQTKSKMMRATSPNSATQGGNKWNCPPSALELSAPIYMTSASALWSKLSIVITWQFAE